MTKVKIETINILESIEAIVAIEKIERNGKVRYFLDLDAIGGESKEISEHVFNELKELGD